jgi:N-ethylmaleimide reductase
MAGAKTPPMGFGKKYLWSFVRMDTNQATDLADLFAPVRLGPLTLPNRIVMAPLTRSRAVAGGVQGEMNARYYAQRASAGLIVSEATNISPQGRGYAFTPGIFSKEQVAGWRIVTDAVHAAGGHIVCQLWHVGRISHPDLQYAYAAPVGPSAVKPEGLAFTESGMQPHIMPRPLRTDEIAGVVADYAHAAACAKEAGFDGVEIHAANGYLIDQFLRSKTNLRTDRYGGSVENRVRFLVEVAEAVTSVWGADRVGVRFAPTSGANDISDADPQTTFGVAVEQMSRLGLAFIHVIEGQTQGPRDSIPGFDFLALRRAFKGLYMANNGLTLELAVQARRDDTADLFCFGRLFISNPDLAERLRTGAPLAPLPPRETWYGGGAHGYTDYPRLDGSV